MLDKERNQNKQWQSNILKNGVLLKTSLWLVVYPGMVIKIGKQKVIFKYNVKVKLPQVLI